MFFSGLITGAGRDHFGIGFMKETSGFLGIANYFFFSL
jgi:hypothetical protein